MNVYVEQANMMKVPEIASSRLVDWKWRLIRAVAIRVMEHALPAAIGKGDHRHNLKRGCEPVLQDMQALSAVSWSGVFKAVGTRFLIKVGGVSGPLYGTVCIALGKELPVDLPRSDITKALGAAIVAVTTPGKSDTGQKTRLDGLVPAYQAFAVNAADISRIAMQLAEAIPLRAIHGRAFFLGDRSINDMNPGARPSSLMIVTVCNELGAF